MKSFVLIAASLALGIVSVNAEAQRARREGGASTGGGNILIAANAPTLEEFQEFVSRDLKGNVYRMLRELESAHYFHYLGQTDAPQYEPVETLFGIHRKADPFAKLEEAQFKILSKGACREKDGKKKDASIMGAGPNGICLSYERIAQQVGREELEKYLTGLALHELSHLVGADEAQAEKIQGLAIQSFVDSDKAEVKNAERKLRIEKMKEYREQMVALIARLAALPETAGKASIDWSEFKKLAWEFDRLYDYDREMNLSIREGFTYFRHRLNFAEYLFAQEGDRSQEEACFQGRATIDVHEALTCFFDGPSAARQEVARRMNWPKVSYLPQGSVRSIQVLLQDVVELIDQALDQLNRRSSN